MSGSDKVRANARAVFVGKLLAAGADFARLDRRKVERAFVDSEPGLAVAAGFKIASAANGDAGLREAFTKLRGSLILAGVSLDRANPTAVDEAAAEYAASCAFASVVELAVSLGHLLSEK